MLQVGLRRSGRDNRGTNLKMQAILATLRESEDGSSADDEEEDNAVDGYYQNNEGESDGDYTSAGEKKRARVSELGVSFGVLRVDRSAAAAWQDSR